jgi:transcriptional regulator with XRE-family HTH domain
MQALPKKVTTLDEITIGARLRILRRWRGMSQVELAGLADLSPSFISMVETGQRPLDRRSHIAGIASALRVSETDLVGGPHLTPDPLQSDPHMAIPALRVALQTDTLSTPAVDRARPLADIVQEVRAQIEPMRRACDYVGADGFFRTSSTSCPTTLPYRLTRPRSSSRCRP